MRSSDQEKLLNDLLRDPNYHSFRGEVYELSLAEFRANRRRRFAPFYYGLAASILVAGLVALAVRGPKDVLPLKEEVSSTALSVESVLGGEERAVSLFVKTVPLEMSEVVRSLPDRQTSVGTRDFFPEGTFSRRVIFGQVRPGLPPAIWEQSILIETSSQSASTVEFFRSNFATVSEVDDAQIFALFPNEPVGFVQTRDGKALILFAEAKNLKL